MKAIMTRKAQQDGLLPSLINPEPLGQYRFYIDKGRGLFVDFENLFSIK